MSETAKTTMVLDIENVIFDALSAQNATVAIHQNDGSWDHGDVRAIAQALYDAGCRVNG